METTVVLQMTLADLERVVEEQVTKAIKSLPLQNMGPDEDELWTAEQIAMCSDYSYPRVLQKIRDGKVPVETLGYGKHAIRYSDIEKIGITVNPFKRTG